MIANQQKSLSSAHPLAEIRSGQEVLLAAPSLSLLSDQIQRATELIIIVDQIKDWPLDLPKIRVVSAADYLHDGSLSANSGITLINLCRSCKYLSVGYYCSLLAEARGHHVLPSVKTINDLSRKAIYSLDTNELDSTLNQKLTGHDGTQMPVVFSMDVCLGVTDYMPLQDLASQIFDTFPAPWLRVEFEHDREWTIRAIKTPSITSLSRHQEALLAAVFQSANRRIWPIGETPKKCRTQIAILHDPEEVLPPSNQQALEKFIHAGRELGAQVSLIEKRDYPRLAEFDALFIRETTAINHHTYLFAKKAESEGIAVIDDSSSILRCTNKIYLADLLRKHDLPTPRTYVLAEDDLSEIEAIEAEIGYPMVTKIPDGAFSRGVSKAHNREEFLRIAHDMYKHSALILVQEYLYTEYDWRIGVLDGKPLFASQYFMSKGHWQVAKRDADGKAEFGACRATPLSEVPPELLEYAVKAANLIGRSLYGVDMKMTDAGPVIIEVNDNPNIDAGIEDGVAGEPLYRMVMQALLQRAALLQDFKAA